MSSIAHFSYTALILGILVCGVGGCTAREVPEQGLEDDDEIVKACEEACPLQFECGFAPEGKTLDDCLKSCPGNLRERRDACSADFEFFACLSTLSCAEYFEYLEALDRKIGTFSDPPPFPCQAEMLANLRGCQGAGEDI